MPRNMIEVRRPRTNQFAEEPTLRIGRSQLNMTAAKKISFDASYLYPIHVEEVYPGDTFTCNLNGFVRLQHPLEAPILDNISVETFWFFIPNRLVWDNWKYFMGEHDDAWAQDTSYTIPVLEGGSTFNHDAGGYDGYYLAAYFGLPHGCEPDNTDINALPFRAYGRVYNEWFRDENQIDEVAVDTGNGPDDLDVAGTHNIRKSAKKHDYFTSALPALQKGTASTGSISGTANVQMASGTTGDNPSIFADDAGAYRYLDADAALVDISGRVDSAPSDQLYVAASTFSIDINAFRQSIAIQRMLEKDARGGTRYVELIKSHFGVTSPDFRLQRTEYLGGGKDWINVNPVAQTDTTVGDLGGYATGIIRGHGWAKSFTEHGFILGLIRARGDVTYFQGIHRMWSRSSKYDFYNPALANLGEQAILRQELFHSGTPSTDAETFGYQERWAELRTGFNQLIGSLNPDSTAALSHWHLAEDLSSATLNQTFIEDQTPMDRVTTTDTAHQFLMDLIINLRAARPIPVHSIPSLIGRRF
jgi:hypothetical protein